MSRQSQAKQARRKKRRADQGGNWLPDDVLNEIVTTQAAIATDLEAFDQRITQRGWIFDEDESDDDFVFWFYEPSSADVDEEDAAPVTTIWMSAEEDAKIVHLMLVGRADNSEFASDEFFAHVDVIEAYRAGDPVPQFRA